MRAEVMTPWVVTTVPDIGQVNECLLTEDYPNTAPSWDSTGQSAENLPPQPNLMLRTVTVDQATLDAIEADRQYHVMWVEDET